MDYCLPTNAAVATTRPDFLDSLLCEFDSVSPRVTSTWLTTTFAGSPSDSFTSQLYTQHKDRLLLGGIGVWAQGSYAMALHNLPPHYELYVKLTVFAFYDFDAVNKEGMKLFVNNQLIEFL